VNAHLIQTCLRSSRLPAVRATKHSVEKAVTLLARNLETDEAEALSRKNRLPTFATGNGCSEFHTLPSQPCMFFLVRQARFVAFRDPYRLSGDELVPDRSL
jgi:hypothetical protein